MVRASKQKSKWIEFKSGKSVDEVLLNTVPTWLRFVIMVCWFVAVLYVVPNLCRAYLPKELLEFLRTRSFVKPSDSYLLFVGFLSFAFLTNKTNLLFATANLRLWKLNVVVLDDLERTSLSMNNIFHVVKEFERIRAKHVVVSIGYSNLTEKLLIMDFAYKSGAYVEEIPNSGKVNVGIVKKYEDAFPFNPDPAPQFLSLFTPRETIEMVERSRKLFQRESPSNVKKAVFIYITLHELFKKLGYGPAELSNITLTNPQSQFAIGQTSTTRGFNIPNEHRDILNSFVSVLDFHFKTDTSLGTAIRPLNSASAVSFSQLEYLGKTFIP